MNFNIILSSTLVNFLLSSCFCLPDPIFLCIIVFFTKSLVFDSDRIKFQIKLFLLFFIQYLHGLSIILKILIFFTYCWEKSNRLPWYIIKKFTNLNLSLFGIIRFWMKCIKIDLKILNWIKYSAFEKLLLFV